MFDERLSEVILEKDGALIITADHGNAEEKLNTNTGEVLTEHSRNKVPFIVVVKELQKSIDILEEGILGDVAPTILSLMGIAKPEQMSGKDLLK